MYYPMPCGDAHHLILQRVDGLLGDAMAELLDAHLADCADCAHFELQQLDLDRRLAAALPPVRLGPEFREAVRGRIAAAAESRQPWLEMMPDYAHLIGCALAITVCAILLPAYAWTILTTGAAIAAFTYVAQTLLSSAMNEMDERRSPARPG